MMPATLLRLTGVARQWSRTSALAPVDLIVERGTFVVVTGRSGSGKSTLLALLAGWTLPDRGTIERVGEWAADEGWQRWSSTAVVPQSGGLTEELTVAENIELVLRLAGFGRGERAAQVADLLDELDLTELALRLPRQTSLGQQQRLSIARALVGRPTVLLADEPTCHQDVDHTHMVLNAFRRVVRAGTAVLVASHDPIVSAAADRVLALDG
jgi:putative ABC transport system ATP-binding protein